MVILVGRREEVVSRGQCLEGGSTVDDLEGPGAVELGPVCSHVQY